MEAKAHVPELLSPPTEATDKSLALIRRSLTQTAAGLGAAPCCDWSQRFYQYTNRLAHAWWLQEIRHEPVRLAFVYFVGDKDMNGPLSRWEWEEALMVLHEALGLRDRLKPHHSLIPPYVTEVFIDIRTPTPIIL